MIRLLLWKKLRNKSKVSTIYQQFFFLIIIFYQYLLECPRLILEAERHFVRVSLDVAEKDSSDGTTSSLVVEELCERQPKLNYSPGNVNNWLGEGKYCSVNLTRLHLSTLIYDLSIFIWVLKYLRKYKKEVGVSKSIKWICLYRLM